MAKYLDETGLGLVWGKIKAKFIAQNSDVEDGHVAIFTVDDSGDNALIGLADGGTVATSTHVHGNITNGGAITATGVTIANGDALTIVDSSDSGKLAKSSITFDGSTTGSYLSKAGTWVSTINSHQSLGLITATSGTGTSENTSDQTSPYVVLLGGGAAKDSIQFKGSGIVSVTGKSGAVTISASHATHKLTATNGTAEAGTNSITYVESVTSNTTTATSGDLAFTANRKTLSNIVTGSGLTNNAIVLGSGSSGVKTSSKTIVTALGSDDSTVPTSKAVADAISGLSGAMHFVGVSTSTMTDGQTTNPTVSGVSTFSAGDVVVDATETEFVLGNESTPKWHKLGDANSYALNSVSITGTGALGGGGDLTASRTITHNTSGVTAGSAGPTSNISGSGSISVPRITVDEYGHITALSSKTYTGVAAANNAALNLQGSSGDAIASGFSANGSTATTFKFAVGTGNTISSIGVAKSDAVNTITINGATMPTTLKNPNAVRLGDNTTYIDYDGSASGYQLSFTGSGVSLAKSGNVVTATITNTTYTLPKATTSALGGIIISNALTSAVTLTSANGSTANRYYGVQVDKDGKAFVNIPWTDQSVADSSHHYSPSGTTALSNTASGNAVSWGGAVVTSLTHDGKGHITGVKTSTLPSNPNVTTSAFVASSTSATAATAAATTISNGNLYYILREGSSNTATLITGAGGTTVTKDANGTNRIVITSTDTKTTAASSDSSSKLFLIGATSQSSTGVTTYSQDTAYVGTDGCLYSNSTKVMVAGDVSELDQDDIDRICV